MVFAALLSLVALVPLVTAQDVSLAERVPVDACVAIAGQKWVAPQDLRACYESFKVDAAVKTNVRVVHLCLSNADAWGARF